MSGYPLIQGIAPIPDAIYTTMANYVTKDEERLHKALVKLINNCADVFGNPKKPTEKQLNAAIDVAMKFADKPAQSN